MRILLHPGISEPWLGKLRAIHPEIEVVVAADEAEAVDLVRQAEAVYGRLTPAMLAAAHRLQWVQASGIGLEGYMFPELVASDVVMTNMRGVYGDHIADHVLAYILTFARGLHLYLRRQMAHTWQPGAPGTRGVTVIWRSGFGDWAAFPTCWARPTSWPSARPTRPSPSGSSAPPSCGP